MIDLPTNLQAAYFDVDGTLSKSNIVEPLLYIKKRLMPPLKYNFWKITLPLRFIYWTTLDKIDRKLATASIYNQYKGISVEQMNSIKTQCYTEKYKKKLFPKALKAIGSLMQQGTRIVLVSGSLDLFLQALAEELGAELIASRLEVKNGLFTGKIKGSVVSGEIKAQLMSEHAEQNRFRLQNCASFGDSKDDIPMLSSVKYPIAVNPNKAMRAYARKNNWDSLIWNL